MKKKYVKPSVTVVEIVAEAALLSASGEPVRVKPNEKNSEDFSKGHSFSTDIWDLGDE